MIIGIAFALAACFIWGLIFVVPEFITGFTSLEIALGRYTFYGLISSCFFLQTNKTKTSYSFSIWIKACQFALVSTIIYYTALVLSLRFCNPALSALILGISPVSIAFYSNWQKKECSYRPLIISSLIIFAGLLVINCEAFLDSAGHTHLALGLLFSGISLVAWTWYAVNNARFLKEHADIHPTTWSTLVGVSSLFWVILTGSILLLASEKGEQTLKFWHFNEQLQHFLLGCAILGVACSWVGGYLWNQACLRLPISLAGQMTIFETLFGLLFVYAVAQEVPPLYECLGILILLAGIGYSIHAARNYSH